MARLVTRPSDIQERLKRRFLDRLAERGKSLRRSAVDRDWATLREECRHVASGGETFGFNGLKDLADRVAAAIPRDVIPRFHNLPEVRAAAEQLIQHIDSLLSTRA